MATRIISQYEVLLPPEMGGITEENFRRFMRWGRDSNELEKWILKKFKPSVCAMAGFSDENRPAVETETTIPVGNLVFQVKTKPTTKRPAYGQVNESFGRYLDFLREQYQADIRRESILTIDGQPYVAVPALKEKIDADTQNLLEGKEGIAQQLQFLEPAELLGTVLERLTVAIGMDYSQVTECNGWVYVHGVNMKKAGDERAGAFKAIVRADSLAMLGTEPSEPVAIGYAFDNVEFVHQMEPRNPQDHKGIIEAFVKPIPNRITRRSSFGDLVKAEELYRQDGFEHFLRERGLLDDAFMSDYAPRQREGVAYVRLEGVARRLEKYRKDITSPSIEQNFWVELK